jgi:predicted TIM-barrel fold metal-dependent hydrolase
MNAADRLRKEVPLRSLLSVLITSCLVFAPSPLRAQDEDRPLYKSSYRIINVHRHCDQPNAALVRSELAVMDRVGVSALVVLDGGTTDGKLPDWLALRKKFPGRLIVFSNVPWRRIKQESFFQDIVTEVTAQQRMGAHGVKIFKDLGMTIRGPDGKLLKGDDPRLDPFWERCGEVGLPVLLHMADPREYWYPLTFNSFHYGMRSEGEQHYDRAKMPSWEELIRQRDSILAKHPKTKFIGAHMGSLTFDLDQLGKTFDKYPNFYVDCSARTRILGRLNPNAVRDFFVKYQDRILFGTDSSVLNNVMPDDVKAVQAWQDKAARFYSRHLEYYETDQLGLMEPYGWGKEWLRLPGVKLPPAVLEKFYHANAEKLIPDLAGPDVKP